MAPTPDHDTSREHRSHEDDWHDELARGLARLAHVTEQEELPTSHVRTKRRTHYYSARAPKRSMSVDERLVAQEREREQPAGGYAPKLQPSLRVETPRPEPAPATPGERPGRRARVLARFYGRRVMRVVMQLALIICICLAGERLADALPIDMPSNICSMIVLLLFLVTGTLKMESISAGADFLLDHMSVFFIPAAVAIMGSFDLIADNVVKLVLICLITTVLVFFVTSFTVSTVMNLMLRREARASAAAQSTQKEGPSC